MQRKNDAAPQRMKTDPPVYLFVGLAKKVDKLSCHRAQPLV